MIIHASLKTDISFFYTNWLIERLKEGIIDIPSITPGEFFRYDFKINPVEKVILHTRNPYKIIKNYNSFKNLSYNYEVITHISMYDKFYEPKINDKYKIFEYICQMGKTIGRQNNAICYGPVFKTINNDIKWHITQFKYLCRILYKAVSTVYYDFGINNTCKNSPYFNAEEFSDESQRTLISEFEKIATKYNLKLEKMKKVEELGYDEIDIGEKDSCPAICKHCKYITNSKTAIVKSGMNNPKSTTLIGMPNALDKIKKVNLNEDNKQIKKTEETLTNKQISLFDML